MNGAEILVKSLEDLGAKRIFGYTGAAILPVFHALAKSRIDVTINANEQCAAFSAAGYSRSSDDVGVAAVTSGPAITNTLTAVADAYCDSIPLLVIAGQVPEHKIGTDSFQHINVATIFKDAAKKVITLTNSQDIESTIKDSYFLAKSGKPGPVVIDFPLDKQQAVQSYHYLSNGLFESSYSNGVHLNDDKCKLFFDLLMNSKRPLLYIGGGLNSDLGSQALRRFNEHFQIPLVHTLMAKGVYDGKAGLNLGMLGMFGTPYANKIIQENDLFFAIGVRWDDRVAEKVGFGLGSEIAYIDINPDKMHQIRLERMPKFTHIGDAGTALDDLLSYGEGLNLDIDGWREKARQIKRSWPLDYNRQSEEIQSAEVMELLSGYIDETMIVTTGVGNHQMLAAQYLPMQRPKSYLTSGSYGTMGFAVPSAIGAHYANPDKTILALDGDGSLRMNLGELHTISMFDIPVKIIMLNNHSDGMVLNLQDVEYGVRTGSQRQKDVNFSKIARDMGFAYSVRVSERKDLQESLEKILNTQGPCFMEVCIDQEEILYPKVPPGASYKDIILGPYIRRID